MDSRGKNKKLDVYLRFLNFASFSLLSSPFSSFELCLFFFSWVNFIFLLLDVYGSDKFLFFLSDLGSLMLN